MTVLETTVQAAKFKEMITICFCQRAEIGLTAEAFAYQKANKMDGLTVQEVLNQKNFKPSGTVLKVSYVPVCTI